MKEYKSLSSTTQERIRDLLRPVLGEVDDPKAAQMSQAELSRMLGINSATLSRFMSGKTVTILAEREPDPDIRCSQYAPAGYASSLDGWCDHR